MKTLEQAQAYHKQVHYRVICDRCHTECIADEKDFDSFFGVPEHTEDEIAWKCPVCGHVNIENIKNILRHLCDEKGNTYDDRRKKI